MTKTTYAPRPKKRKRRTKAEMDKIREFLVELVNGEGPMTLRHAFYRTVASGLIDKTEAEYKKTVGRLLVQLRRSGKVSYSMLTDGTRWQIKPRSYGSLDDALDEMQTNYRHALWHNQHAYVEVWCEKDAICSILSEVTDKWDVPLFPTHGYSSLTLLWSIAEQIKEIDKPTYIYYFGDHDPSGRDIRRCVEKEVRGFAPDVEFHFKLCAVTPQQIEELDLPTRPTKKSDSRAKGFVGESVEIDAIPAETLKELAEDCILRHVDRFALGASQAIEDAERETLAKMLEGYRR